jgi:hypothetical protein
VADSDPVTVWLIGTAAEEEAAEAAEAHFLSRKVSLLKVSLLKVSLLKVSLLKVSLLKVSRKPTQEIRQELTYCQPPKQNIYY